MPKQSSPTSVTTASSDQDRSERARGRWKILRKALLKQPNGEENAASIHRFTGYGYRMLPASIVAYQKQPLHDKLRMIRSIEDLELSLRAFIALAPQHPLLELHTPSLAASELHAPATQTGSKVVAFDAKKELAYIRLPEEPNPLYCIKAYRLPTSEDKDDATNFLWIHEKRSRSVSSLHDLVRHRETGIDNTGDVCVWDAALTLAWALQQQQDSAAHTTTILELGAGMAAMAGLSLLKTSPSARLIITDGQASAVANNRVHCRCMGLESKVDCRVLVWSTSIAEPSLQADRTLIADCTHFTDFHAGLFWTAIYHTSVGGNIWMCQPERTKTWDQFLSLVKDVNNEDPLVTVQEKSFPELIQMHETFTTNDATYNPNLHRPRIFVLTKVRRETETDCQKATLHMQERDTN